MPWGGSKGPTLGGVAPAHRRRARTWAGTTRCSSIQFRTALVEELRAKDLVIVPELNFMGQMSRRISGRLGINAESITQITGLPFKVKVSSPGHFRQSRQSNAERECNSMTTKNPEYDFKWCPGCGDFGVRRALEGAIQRRVVRDRDANGEAT